jgi:hypothetical protein
MIVVTRYVDGSTPVIYRDSLAMLAHDVVRKVNGHRGADVEDMSQPAPA